MKKKVRKIVTYLLCAAMTVPSTVFENGIVKAEDSVELGGVVSNSTQTTTASALVFTSKGMEQHHILFSGGDGTIGNPYQIATAEQLKQLLEVIYFEENHLSEKNYQLIQDISLDGVKLNYQNTEDCAFSGIFDGNGHSIIGLKAESLFPRTENAVIKNLNIKSAEISGTENIGTIVGYGEKKLTIENCIVDQNTTIKGIVSQGAVYIGGICGTADYAEISHCTSSAICETVVLNDDRKLCMGGIIGKGANITDCENYGNMKVLSQDSATIDILYLGGIAGYANIVENSINQGKVVASDVRSRYFKDCNIGGIAGQASDAVISCVNKSDIISINEHKKDKDNIQGSIGGIVGQLGDLSSDNNWNRTQGIICNKVLECINNGNVITTYDRAGGILGYLHNPMDSDIANCLNTGNITAGRYAGGIVRIIEIWKNNADSPQKILFSCQNTGNISGTGYTGGITGYAKGEVLIEKCSNSGTITLHQETRENMVVTGGVGGIAGYCSYVSVCENTGNVSQSKEIEDAEEYVGGIVGKGNVYASTNRGEVTAATISSASAVGSITGEGTVATCVNEASVQGIQTIGGLAGISKDIFRSYNTGDISGEKNVGGLVGTIDGSMIQSYTVGTITKVGASNNIGAVVGTAVKINAQHVFYLDTSAEKVIGDDTKTTAIKAISASDLKKDAIINTLNEIVRYEDTPCFSEWKHDNRMNQGYPVLWTTGLICEDKLYRQIVVYSDKPVYYAELPLKAKAYTVYENNLKEAVGQDGYYVIDYSSYKLNKAYCIAVTLEKKDYQVQGFQSKSSYAYREVFVHDGDDDSITKYEKAEKVYMSKGSNFEYLAYQRIYVPKYTSKLSGVKLDFNWNDYSSASGMDLIAAYTGTYLGVISVEKYEVEYEKTKKIKYKYSSGNENGLTAFVWKLQDDAEWKKQSELTAKKLKEYAEQNKILLLRFRTYYTLSEVLEDYEAPDMQPEEFVLFNRYGNFYGTPIKLKLKSKRKAAPKVKINYKKANIGIKNGMQYSYDQEIWNTILPYKKVSNKYISLGNANGYIGYREVIKDGYTSKKITNLPVDFFDTPNGKVYIRSVGKNTLPSQALEISLSSANKNSPLVEFDSETPMKVVSISMPGNTTGEYEYCITTQSLSYFVQQQASYNWTALKAGTVFNNKKKTVYSWKDYKIGYKDDDEKRYYWDYMFPEDREKDTEWLKFYEKIKQFTQKYTCKLDQVTWLAEYGSEFADGNFYLAVRKKGTSSELPSRVTYYRYDKEKQMFQLIAQGCEL